MRTASRVLLGLLIAFMFAGCGGSPATTGSSNGTTQVAGKQGTDSPSTCTGTGCEPTPAPQCTADAQCASVRAACSVCADGSSACPRAVCENGQCNVVMPSCPQPTGCGGIASLPCADGQVCVDDPNDKCEPDSGGADCPGVCVPETTPRACGGLAGATCPPAYKCVDDPSDACDPAKGDADCAGICQPAQAGTCESDADCPPFKAECSVCPDGTTACPQSTCTNGLCNVVVPTCPAANACGGIAGTPCERGYECVDDPNDTCDPKTGGADCPGICVPAGPPPPLRCAGLAGTLCPAGFECVDDPADGCDPANGGADCGGLCQPVASPQCTTDADCPIIGAPCKLCADGSAACPHSFCSNGQCAAVFEGCAPTPQ